MSCEDVGLKGVKWRRDKWRLSMENDSGDVTSFVEMMVQMIESKRAGAGCWLMSFN